MWDKELILQRELEVLSSEQLRTMLHAETDKDVPDDDLVLSILHILEDREPEVPDSGPEKEKAAWKLYRKRIRARRKTGCLQNSRLLRAAIVVLVCCLLFAMVPQQVEADNWWQRLTKWTSDFFGFFREEEETFRIENYVFETDNPGLQQVYDAVLELGVTIPAVPMWLPEGYELAEITIEETRIKQYVYARFLNNTQECSLKINILNEEAAKAYFKNDVDIQNHESGGMFHSLVRNVEVWAVSWRKDNIECSIFIDCAENVLYEIIDSIYRWRVDK